MKTSTIKDVEVIDFSKHKEKSGTLIPIEAGKEVPFDITRVFYIFDVPPGEIRGKHAHKKQKQLLICLKGKCDVILKDTLETMEVVLERPDVGVYIPPGVWDEIVYHEKDTVLIVLTDGCYDPDDYVNTWNEFLALKRESL